MRGTGRAARAEAPSMRTDDGKSHEAIAGPKWGRVSPWWWRAVRKHPNALVAIGVAIEIARHADSDGVAWPAQDTIAAELGISRSSVDRAVRVLIDVGVMSRRRRQRLSNAYCMHFDTPPSDVSNSVERTSPGRLDASADEALGGSLMRQDSPLDTSTVDALDASADEAQTDQGTELEQNDVGREDDKEKNGRQAIISALVALGFTTGQAAEAAQNHYDVAFEWSRVGFAGVPTGNIRSPIAFIIAAIRGDRMPERPKPSRYGRDFTGVGRQDEIRRQQMLQERAS